MTPSEKAWKAAGAGWGRRGTPNPTQMRKPEQRECPAADLSRGLCAYLSANQRGWEMWFISEVAESTSVLASFVAVT